MFIVTDSKWRNDQNIGADSFTDGPAAQWQVEERPRCTAQTIIIMDSSRK